MTRGEPPARCDERCVVAGHRGTSNRSLDAAAAARPARSLALALALRHPPPPPNLGGA